MFSSLTVKRIQSNMPRVYAETANDDMKDLPPYIEECCIEYIPTMGHCLCVRSWLAAEQPMTPSALSINGLELKVTTATTTKHII